MDHRDWKAEAANDLRQPNYSPRKLVLIHTGVIAGLSVLLSLVGLLLDMVANNAGGGLGNMGTQTLLATVQTFLPLLVLLVQPFWNVGIQNAALGYGANRSVQPRDLLGGFYRWKPIITSSLMIGVLYMTRIFITSFLSGQIMAFTPFADDVMKAAEAQMENPEADIFALMGDSLIPFVGTYAVVFFGLFIAFSLPVYYRYRFVNYILLEQPGMGGMQAMLLSRAMTQGHRKQLFKLDLSFWWFYLAEVLISALCYTDVFLQLAGVKLPMPPMVASWVFLLLSLGLQLALHVYAKPILEVSWIKAYRQCNQIPVLDPMELFRHMQADMERSDADMEQGNVVDAENTQNDE